MQLNTAQNKVLFLLLKIWTILKLIPHLAKYIFTKITTSFNGQKNKQIVSIPSNRDGKVEDGQHPGPGFLDEHVTDDGGRDSGVAGLPNADYSSHN